MQQVTLTVKFVISDTKLEKKNPELMDGISMDYLLKHGTRIYRSTDVRQLYNVQIPLKYVSEGKVRRDQVTALGFLAHNEQKCNYTRGQAIKKARVFEGKVVKCVD